MSAFTDALQTGIDAIYDVLGVDIAYLPQGGGRLEISAVPSQPDVDAPVLTAPTRRQVRVIKVKTTDLPAAAKGDRVELPRGGTSYPVIDAAKRDDYRLEWTIELGNG